MDWQHVAIGVIMICFGLLGVVAIVALEALAFMVDREIRANPFRLPAYVVILAFVLGGFYELIWG